MALLFYLGPNMVQDVHRVFGHHHHHHCESQSGTTIHRVHGEKCSVCVFEFNVVNEAPASIFTVLLATCNTVFTHNINHQLTSKVFDYSQLRAPPVS